MRRFYKVDDPMVIIHAEQVAAIHGGVIEIPKVGITAWMARALSAGTLAKPCTCCTSPTDMISDADPSVIVPEEEFFAQYREISLRVN